MTETSLSKKLRLPFYFESGPMCRRKSADRTPTARDGNSLFAEKQLNITDRNAVDPIGIITHWDTPFMLSTWKIAPALAAGCTVIHKPLGFFPLSAKLLIEIVEEADLSSGV